MVQVVKRFKAPRKSMADIDADAAARLLIAAADVALVLDARGVIRDLALGSDELSQHDVERWLGQPWVDVVTVESKPKIEQLLREADAETQRWRQVNHPSARGGDVPVIYSAVRLNQGSRTIAIGRSMRAIASLQQRLVHAQQTMEREYTRLTHAETRYRLLFRLASEAVLIVDALSMKVVEANPAAQELFAPMLKRLVGGSFPQGFDPSGTKALQELVVAVRSGVAVPDLTVRAANNGGTFHVSASLFQQNGIAHCLVRLSPVAQHARALPPGGAKERSRVLEVVESLPDGFVVADLEGVILTANKAFLDLVRCVNPAQVQGQSLERWLGRPGVDMSVLVSNLREHGSIRLFATTIRDETGGVTDVEVSGVAVLDGVQPCLGLTIRNVARRLNHSPRAAAELPRSPAQLAELIGKVPLKDLVRESTDVIERLCIEAALELTGDNRASAAEMLGLSRQSLYAKLRRYGLGDLDADE